MTVEDSTGGDALGIYSPDGAFAGYSPVGYTPPVVRYLSPTGNDTTGTGAIGAPYKTFPKARTDIIAADGGDIIYLPGLYDYANCAPGIDESHGIDTLSSRRVRIMGPGVAGKLQSEMAHITNFSGNSWLGIQHGCFVGNVNWVEVRGLWIDCNNVASMGLRVQGDFHLYDTGGRFRRRGRLVQGIVVDDCLVENSRQTNMNFRGNLWNAQVTNNISRAPGRDGGFVGEGIYFGTEPRSYGDDEAMSVARSYARFIAEGGSTSGTTVLYEIDCSHNCLLQGNTIDLAYPGGISQSECVEVKPLSGTTFAQFDNNAFTSQVWAPGAGPLLSSLTRTATLGTAIKVNLNTLLNAGRSHVLVKGTASVEGNTIGAPAAGNQATVSVGRQAYQGPETGGFTLVTGDVAWVENNVISPSHAFACAFAGEFSVTGQQIHVCGNTGPSGAWEIWPNGPAYSDGTASRAAVLAEFGDPRDPCL